MQLRAEICSKWEGLPNAVRAPRRCRARQTSSRTGPIKFSLSPRTAPGRPAGDGPVCAADRTRGRLRGSGRAQRQTGRPRLRSWPLVDRTGHRTGARRRWPRRPAARRQSSRRSPHHRRRRSGRRTPPGRPGCSRIPPEEPPASPEPDTPQHPAAWCFTPFSLWLVPVNWNEIGSVGGQNATDGADAAADRRACRRPAAGHRRDARAGPGADQAAGDAARDRVLAAAARPSSRPPISAPMMILRCMSIPSVAADRHAVSVLNGRFRWQD